MCSKTLGVNIDDHFREVTKMIDLAKGAKHEIQDFMRIRSKGNHARIKTLFNIGYERR